MIYIIEGPDGAGKTTLVNKILKTTPGATTFHFGAPKSEEEDLNYWMLYYDVITKRNPNSVVIFDRSWFSDMVYGPVMRGHTAMKAQTSDMLAKTVIDYGGGIIIYCTAATHVLWERCNKRGEDDITGIDKLDQISKNYERLMSEHSILPVVRYNTDIPYKW